MILSYLCHSLKLSFHLYLCHPLPLLPSISAWYTLLTILSGTISSNASLLDYLLWLFFPFSSTPSSCSFSLISTFLTLSTLLFSTICLNTRISVAWTANSCCLFSTHVSLPYITVGTMMALYTVNFVLLLNSFLFHTSSFNTPITFAAFPILVPNFKHGKKHADWGRFHGNFGRPTVIRSHLQH